MEPETNQTQAPAKNMGLLYGTIAVVIILAAAAGYFFLTSDVTNDTGAMNVDGEETGPVAIVNGEEISREAYNTTIAQINASLGQDADAAVDPQIQSQVVDSLVNNALLRQAVTEANVTVTDAEIQTEYEMIMENSGGAEELAQQLETLGMTEAELREDIAEQLAINTYVKTQAALETITVSDEEISTYYDQLSATNEEVAPLEEISEQIREQLLAQKQQESAARLIESLRADADIEILI